MCLNPYVTGNASSPIAYWVAFGAPDRGRIIDMKIFTTHSIAMHWIIAVFFELIFGITKQRAKSLILP